jgi:hypothetical protein
MAITNGYCTLQQLKDSLRISDNVDDTMLELAIETASRQIDDYCERVFYTTSATRYYTPRDSYVCETDDIVSITTLKSSSAGNGTYDITWATTDYQTEPLNGIAGGISSPVTHIRAIGNYLFPMWSPSSVNAGEATVQVVGTFGWSAVPTAIKYATILLSSRLFKRMDSPLGVAGIGDLGVIRVSRIDPDIDALISPFKKMRMA